MDGFKIGLIIHKLKYKNACGKGYLPNFTEEYVKIKPVAILLYINLTIWKMKI